MRLSRFTRTVAALAVCACWGAQRYPVSGLLVAVDRPHQTVVVSHDAIPGYMGAMVMPFHVRAGKGLDGLRAGAKVAFTLVVDRDASWAEEMRTVEFYSAERDPELTRGLLLLESILEKRPAATLAVGKPVPDFTLIDQESRPVVFSRLAGRVVAMNFAYTRCPLPDYCFRLSNNLGVLQKRFAGRMGRDLILLTVTFDPVHDPPDVMAKYARIWRADPRTWHFLTGSEEDVRRVCDLFGVRFWQEEGTYVHSLHTVVIDRGGRLAANLEGNQFTAQQLGDLVESVFNR